MHLAGTQGMVCAETLSAGRRGASPILPHRSAARQPGSEIIEAFAGEFEEGPKEIVNATDDARACLPSTAVEKNGPDGLV